MKAFVQSINESRNAYESQGSRPSFPLCSASSLSGLFNLLNGMGVVVQGGLAFEDLL